MNERPLERVGSYRFVEKLGEGGMGVVYRARDERLGREVAVKVLKREAAGDVVRLQRFASEARAMAAVSHPNIVAIHDVGTWDGIPFLVTELLEGESLWDRMRDGRLSVATAVEYAIQAARGLQAAHDMGIAHRDLKTENIFLTSDGQVKLLDFGIATLVENDPQPTDDTDSAHTRREDTQPGGSAGTPGCMAPEQIRGLPADHRADIFAVGVALYEMLSGRRPFQGGTPGETMAMVLHDDPPPLGRRLPEALTQIVSRCLEKRPEDRFSSAHDLALALRAASVGGPSARRVWTQTRTGGSSLSWRRRVRLAAAAAFAAVTILGFYVFVVRSDRGLLSPDLNPHRIAVVPFTCNGDCGRVEPLGILAAVRLASALTTLREVEVVRTEEASAVPIAASPVVYRIATSTNAGLVLSGSWRREGAEVEFSAALEDAMSGEVVALFGPATASHDAPGEALRVLCDQALVAVQDHLHPSLKFAAGDRWPRLEAYNNFRSSLELSGSAPLEASLDHVERALEIDPEFIRPRLVWAGAFTFSRARFLEGVETTERVLKLLPEDRSRLSFVQEQILDGILFRLDGNWRGATLVFQDVLERDPQNCIPRLYVIDSAVRANRPRQAVAAFDGMEWDGVQPPQPREIAFLQTARAFHLLGKHDKETEVIESIGESTGLRAGRLWLMEHSLAAHAGAGDLDLLDVALVDLLAEPSALPLGHVHAMIQTAAELREHGHEDAATRLAERALDELYRSDSSPRYKLTYLELCSDAMSLAGRPDDAYSVVLDALEDTPGSFERSRTVGLAAARAGDRDKALLEMFHLAYEFNPRPSGETDYTRARIAALVGERREAVRLLRRAIVNGFWDYPALRACPDLESLRDDPEYQRLIEPKG